MDASKQALVFGGAGFLGHEIVKELVSGGWEVLAADFTPSSKR